MHGRIAIIRYMNNNIMDHVDSLTGEVNDTSLAEDACSHFNDYEGDNIPEDYFDYSFQVAEAYEIKTGVKSGKIGGASTLINSRQSDWF
jgi:hypothetical protein